MKPILPGVPVDGHVVVTWVLRDWKPRRIAYTYDAGANLWTREEPGVPNFCFPCWEALSMEMVSTWATEAEALVAGLNRMAAEKQRREEAVRQIERSIMLSRVRLREVRG